MLLTALVGIAVNIGAAWLISKANRTSLNVEGAFQHILNDLYAFRVRPGRRHRRAGCR